MSVQGGSGDLWNADTFERKFQTFGLLLEESRDKFKTYHSDVLRKMVNGQMRRVNRFRQLLLGRKGIGKTVIMEALGEAAKAAGNVIVVRVDYSAPSSAKIALRACSSRVAVGCKDRGGRQDSQQGL